MNVQVLLFAQARESAGTPSLSLSLPDGSTVGDALASLEQLAPGLAALRAHLATAVNGELVRADAPLTDGVELALLPPVSGG